MDVLFDTEHDLWICARDGNAPRLIRPTGSPMYLHCDSCGHEWDLVATPRKRKTDG